MTGPAVVLDACTLIPIRLATTLLWLAETGLFQPLWSEEILDEVRRNLPKVGVEPAKASRRVDFMREAFGAEALVGGFEDLIDDMDCDPKDRHVLAAAVAAGADSIVTFNLKDFPDEPEAAHGIRIIHPDSFLVELLGSHSGTVVATLEAQTEAFRSPPESMTQFLATLTATVPMFANLAADAFRSPPRAVSTMPALVVGDEEEALASLGDPGDLTDPAQVALIWWIALERDSDVVQALTFHPPSWGDYQWAVEELAGRSLASKVLRAVDAPDTVAFMRFVPEVAATSQVMEPYLATMTFLTLIQVSEGTWRVWGLGPRILAARDIIGD